MPIILWQKCEGWETVSAYGEESVRISAPDKTQLCSQKLVAGRNFSNLKKEVGN